MIKHNQDGAVNGVVISLVFTVLLLIGAIGFAGWAFSSREDYKNNVDSKIQVAEKAAKAQESASKDKQFAEEAKKPLKTYSGPEAYGSLKIEFPKTWSGYADDTGKGNAIVDAYFHPGTVPSTASKDSVFALHVQVLSQSYSEALANYTSLQQDGKLTISAYALPKLPKVVGVKINGALADDTTGTIVLLPLRSQAIQIQTMGTQYLKDYNENILPNFSFSP